MCIGGDESSGDNAGGIGSSDRIITLIAEFDRRIAHMSFADVARGALAFISEHLGFARATVALLGKDRQSFRLFDTTLEVTGIESGRVVPFDSGTLGATVESRATICREDMRQWPHPNLVDSALLAAGALSSISVPLMSEGTCIGALGAVATSVGGIDRVTRQVIELLAPRLAFAIRVGMEHDQLTESEARFRYVFETVGDGIIVADVSNRKILMVNAAICGMLGRSATELLELTISAIHPSDHMDEVIATFVSMVEGHTDHALEVPMLRADGSVFLADVTARSTTVSGKDCVVGVFRDATIRRQREHEQVHFQKLESIRTLAAGIAHDFNNLLTGLIGNMSLAETYCDEGSEAAELLAQAQRAAFRATALTRQLLTFAKGGTPLRKVTDIVPIVRDSASLACRGTNVQCQFDLPKQGVLVLGDEGQLAQAIQNIVRNAVEAMPGGGTVQVKIDVERSQQTGESQEVHIEIRDHGSGIDPALLDRLFVPFFTTKSHGSGLGLAVTYSIVQSHGGRITIASKPAVGTTVHSYFPLARTAEPESPLPIQADSISQALVLFMDDQAVVRNVAERALRRAGCDVWLVATGEEAIAAYREAMEHGRRFDAVVLDLTVPGGMGGREAAAKLLAIDPKAKIIVSSGYSDDGVMSDHERHGFLAVLPKPYNASQLVDTVARLLR